MLFFPQLQQKTPAPIAGCAWEVVLQALQASPQRIIDHVVEANLRGRGGAGFATGKKWQLLSPTYPRYLIVNGDEGEPGTCKDHDLLRFEAPLIVAGLILAAYAIEANWACIFLRHEFRYISKYLEEAVAYVYKAGIIKRTEGTGPGRFLQIVIRYTAGGYICGDETALLNSLEGKKAMPRLKPPFFPAARGLYNAPTIINNIETIANVRLIMQYSPSYYKSIGVVNNYGPKIFALSGMLKAPCTLEAPLGIPLQELLSKSGGIIGGHKNFLCAFPGGTSMPLIDDLEVAMDFDSLKAINSGLGTGAVIVITKDINFFKVLEVILRFYKNESCGQCSPCREGSRWLFAIAQDMCQKYVRKQILHRDLDLLERIANNIAGKTICGFGDGLAWPVQSFVKMVRKHYNSCS